jgi:signal transduction histidine kinase/BarA-like signal transduction histidine kinase
MRGDDTSPQPIAEPSELERLRQENHALGEQVKTLVQLEQRLYRSQNALDQELRRIRALGAFALQLAAVTEQGEVLRETCKLLHDCFSLDRLALLRWTADGEASMVLGSSRAAEPVTLQADELEALGALTPVTLAPPGELPPGLARLFGRLCLQTEHVLCLALSAGAVPAVILALSVARKRPIHRDEQLGELHRPFLQLVGTHLRRAIEHCVLTADLRARSQSLTEVNTRLSESLQRLESTQAQLIESSKMEAIGRLAGGVAHDFNNLLTVILNHTSLAASGLAPESPEHEDLEQVMEAGRRAAEITSQLLALGRKQICKGTHLELGTTAQEVCRMLRTLLGRGVSLEVEVTADCVIVADRTQIEQVVMNLVLNARDAMPQGGVVRVLVRVAAAADVAELTPAVAPESMVVLEVIDTGVGMDPSTRARIFEPFFTTKAAGHGTGLGLSVVYGVVAHAGGHVAVHSAPAQGTRVAILLPRRERVAVLPTAEPRPAFAQGTRLLVVEDSEAIRRVVVRILGRAGFEVTEASDGVDALSKVAVQQRAFDLVLTDLNMPRMGGFELAERLANVLPEAQVVFMTGFSEELADVSRRAPQWPCMTKPFTPAQLLARVREQLDRVAVRAS